MLTVKDIYIGKPDAKDEIISQKSDEFLESFVIPPNFDFEKLISGDEIFINGYKGTGKTALLLYLNAKCKEKDILTCSSFILFKSNYGNVQKLELENISKNIIKTIGIDKEILIRETDFEYIWKWIIFKQIIDDNNENNGAIFIEDSNWYEFKEIVDSILSEKSSNRFFRMPNKVKMGVGYTYNNANANSTIKPEILLDFDKKDNIDEYSSFIKLLDKATEIFHTLKRTEIPYYIFVDELEAFYAEANLLQRDLTMIRDLIITIKNINTLFIESNFNNTKIVCSIRTEIVNSIMKFVPSKEINKIISGYECPLVWNYSNTNSYTHPIFEIWLKRIELSENRNNFTFKNKKEIYEKWFCPEVDEVPTVTYILNNTWNKPRDIVRFLNSTKNTLFSNRNVYSPGIFHASIQEYSQESLKEIKEELNALYTPQELDVIFMCLTGYKPYFSYEELVERINKYFNNSFLKINIGSVLNDLYRVGIIGNRSKSSGQYRWQHKSNDGIIFDEEWDICVHKALWKSLSLSEKHGRISKIIEENNKKDLYGTIVKCVVEKVVLGFAIVTFEINDEKLYGSIHISELSSKYIKNIFDFIKIGDILEAKVLNYNKKHLKWVLTCKNL
ncbi:P-loop ATPase, Sll1717 family [Clostridium nigeriense]|uniref:P-loop ATPase, Sll1717 family n=1 Tax=Clostridium nigeriense TaxID=1805470 RepID=UPI003D3424C1